MSNTAVPKDVSGRVVQVHDGLDGISTSLKYVTYQIDRAGAGNEPHPWLWTASMGHLRGVLGKESELVAQVAGNIDRWLKAHPDVDAANSAAMREASKYLKGISRSLGVAARNARNAQACLDVTNTP